MISIIRYVRYKDNVIVEQGRRNTALPPPPPPPFPSSLDPEARGNIVDSSECKRVFSDFSASQACSNDNIHSKPTVHIY